VRLAARCGNSRVYNRDLYKSGACVESFGTGPFCDSRWSVPRCAGLSRICGSFSKVRRFLPKFLLDWPIENLVLIELVKLAENRVRTDPPERCGIGVNLSANLVLPPFNLWLRADFRRKEVVISRRQQFLPDGHNSSSAETVIRCLGAWLRSNQINLFEGDLLCTQS
jgi:hypothetical protein